MAFRSRLLAVAAALSSIVSLSGAADAQLFWKSPDFSGQPVTGEEPGILQPLPGATPEELQAGLVWTLRAGLNVAALQCQFAPGLRTVSLYNDNLRHHDGEFDDAQATLLRYFTRTEAGAPPPSAVAKPRKGKAKGKAGKAKAPAASKAGQNDFDQFTTRTYNSFSTLHAQYGYCQTAGKIGRIALGAEKGGFHTIATQYMREFRNSLIPAGDLLYSYGGPQPIQLTDTTLPDACFDKNGQVLIKKKGCRIGSS